MPRERQYRVSITWIERYYQSKNVIACSMKEAKEIVEEMIENDGIDFAKGYGGMEDMEVDPKLLGSKREYRCFFKSNDGKEEFSVLCEAFPADIVTASWEVVRKLKGEKFYGQFIGKEVMK